MTNLYDGQITDLLANGLRHNPEVIALSYAIQLEKQRIMDYAATTRTMAVIDELPEAILDVLAVELRSPYYRQDMTIEEKVSVVKSCTFTWFSKAGTVAAVEEMISVLFGGGQVVEWFDFDETDGEIVPGEFDLLINTELPENIDELIEEIGTIIAKVKNVRSRLRTISVARNPIASLVTGGFVQSWTEVAVTTSLIIITQPEDCCCYTGDAVEFTVAVSGKNLTYQWQYKASTSSTWRNCTGTTGEGYATDTLTLIANIGRSGFQYRCVISDESGNEVVSEAATLTVTSPTETLTITQNPTDVNATKGDTVTFTVVATSSLGEALTYQWQYMTATGTTWKDCTETTGDGYNTSSVTLKANMGRNGYQYRCVVSDESGNQVISEAATLTVTDSTTTA